MLVLYSNDCPKCKVLKKKLDTSGLEYELCSDMDELVKRNILSVPVLKVNDKFLFFADAVKYVNENQKK